MTKTRCTAKTKKGTQCKGKYLAMCGVHKPGKKKRKKVTKKRVSKGMATRLSSPIFATPYKGSKNTPPPKKKKVSRAMANRLAEPLF